jgi:hypothetical protein
MVQTHPWPLRTRRHYGKRSSWQRPYDAENSSRAQSGAGPSPRSQYGLNVKIVMKWRNRGETADAPMGPKPKSTVLTSAEEAIIVEFRGRTWLHRMTSSVV